MKNDFPGYEKLLSAYAEIFDMQASSSMANIVSSTNYIANYWSIIAGPITCSPAISSISAFTSVTKNMNISNEAVTSALSTFKTITEQYKMVNDTLAQSVLQAFSCIASTGDNLIKIANLCAKALSPLTEVDLTEEDNVHIDLPEQLSEFVNAVDNTIELPQSDSENLIRIEKTNPDVFWKIISMLLTIIGIIIPIYLNAADTKLSEQQHAEIMQLEQKHHDENMREECKQTDYLKIISENTAQYSDTISQPSETNETPEE